MNQKGENKVCVPFPTQTDVEMALMEIVCRVAISGRVETASSIELATQYKSGESPPFSVFHVSFFSVLQSNL